MLWYGVSGMNAGLKEIERAMVDFGNAISRII